MATSTASSEEMVFETIQQLDYPVLREVANLIDVPENKTGTKFGLLKVVLRRELSSVKLERTKILERKNCKLSSLVRGKFSSNNFTK